MKKIFLFFILSVSVFFIQSCCRNGKTFPIKNKDKLRFNENDTFIYKSNFNNYDTLYISEIEEGKNDQYIHEGLCAGKTFYQEKIFYYYQDFHNPFKDENRPYLLITNNSDVITFNTSFHEDEFVGTKARYTLGDYYINDSIYSNVDYIITYDKITRDIHSKYLYNKEYGFLAYEFQNGEKYNLIKYISYE